MFMHSITRNFKSQSIQQASKLFCASNRFIHSQSTDQHISQPSIGRVDDTFFQQEMKKIEMKNMEDCKRVACGVSLFGIVGTMTMIDPVMSSPLWGAYILSLLSEGMMKK